MTLWSEKIKAPLKKVTLAEMQEVKRLNPYWVQEQNKSMGFISDFW